MIALAYTSIVFLTQINDYLDRGTNRRRTVQELNSENFVFVHEVGRETSTAVSAKRENS